MKRALTMALVAALAGGSLAAQAYEKGDFVLRLGAVNVDPDSDSSKINLPGVPTLKTEVDDDTQFGIIPMYMVTEKVGIELLAATPFKHDISLKGKGPLTLLLSFFSPHSLPSVFTSLHFHLPHGEA